MTLPKNHLAKTPTTDSPTQARFWEEKSLDAMNDAEWEAICDGCGRCCLVLLIDDETNEVLETDVACRLFDPKTRRCGNYANRSKLVPDCVTLDAQAAQILTWMPKTCGYRRLANGEGLPDWHPLITGTRNSVEKAGIATPQTLLSEADVKERDLPGRVRRMRS